MSGVTIATSDGEHLHVTAVGRGPAIVVLHGFTGSGAAMETLSGRLAAHHTVVSIDLLGHGVSSSPRDPNRYRAGCLADDVLHVISEMSLDQPGLVGYSMGGRLALFLACTRPGAIEKLAVIGVGPGLSGERVRAERVAADEALASRIEHDGVAAFVEEWMSRPLIAEQSGEGEAAWKEARARRLEQNPAGLTGTLRGFGQGTMPQLTGALAALAVPLLAVAGSEDERYLDQAKELVRLVPHGELKIITGAGHAPHLVAPAATATQLEAFFEVPA